MEASLLLPGADEDSAGFWDGCREGELRVQRCLDCQHLRFPARPRCPRCTGAAFEWHAMSGRGRIWSWVVAHPPLLPAYAADAPYPVVVVQLDEAEHLRMVGNVVSGIGQPLNSVPPEALTFDQPVHVEFEEVDGGDGQLATLPRWIIDD